MLARTQLKGLEFDLSGEGICRNVKGTCSRWDAMSSSISGNMSFSSDDSASIFICSNSEKMNQNQKTIEKF